MVPAKHSTPKAKQQDRHPERTPANSKHQNPHSPIKTFQLHHKKMNNFLDMLVLGLEVFRNANYLFSFGVCVCVFLVWYLLFLY